MTPGSRAETCAAVSFVADVIIRSAYGDHDFQCHYAANAGNSLNLDALSLISTRIAESYSLIRLPVPSKILTFIEGLFVLVYALEPFDMEDRPDERLVLPDDEMDGTS